MEIRNSSEEGGVGGGGTNSKKTRRGDQKLERGRGKETSKEGTGIGDLISPLCLPTFTFHQNISMHKIQLWSLGELFLHLYFQKYFFNKDTKFRVVSSGIASPKASL